jgi:hypothetical protein
VPWDARLQTPLDRMGLLDVLESAPVGTNATALVSPGRLQGSALFLRVSEMGAFHMPPLGGFELNASAISMLAEWITNALPARRGYADWAAGVFGGASSDLAAMTADPDGDGLDNFAEYLLRESPYDATIRWRPMIERTPGDGLRLLFPRIAGRKHEAVWTDTPLDVSSWRRLESSKNDPRPAESDGVAVLPLPPADARFYRVRVTID